jgi:hypothetical protein
MADEEFDLGDVEVPDEVEVGPGEVVVRKKIRSTFRLGKGAGQIIQSASSDGQKSWFHLSRETGTVKFKITGQSRQGEEGTDAVAWTLIERLVQLGARWSTPQPCGPGDGDVDWVAEDADDPKRRLRIQVIRAITDPKVWGTLSREGPVIGETSIEGIADALYQSIQKKAKKRYGQPGNITLALDAVEPGTSGFYVVEVFIRKYGAECMTLGFESIWLVGPNEQLVYRLDTTEPPTH